MLELLSPAGSPEAVTAAVQNGANAVYLGCGDFNARRRAKNFTPDDLRWAVEYCHVRGAKVYLTLNTLVTDRELPAALAMGELANRLGVDAVLVQDLGLAAQLHAQFPDLPLHGSTQMTVHSLDGVRFCADRGLTRVVLSRELSREAIAHICRHSPVEIEVFAHGALCMCYSGQCFLSAVLGGRSGNRGLCAQPCRLPYDGGHPLSLKDMSLAGYLRELEELGVACVKLEGRMKRPEYVAVVTGVYAAALREGREPTGEEMSRLQAAFSRSGFTQGYYLNQTGPQMFGTRTETTPPEDLYAQARTTYQKERPLVDVDLEVNIRAGAPITAAVSDGCGRSVHLPFDPPETALHRAVTDREVAEQLSKTGGTPYRVAHLSLELDPGLAVPKSLLNRMRRELLDTLTALRSTPPRRRWLSPPPPAMDRSSPAGPPELIYSLRTADQLTPQLLDLPHRFIDLPLAELAAHPETAALARARDATLRAVLPRVCWDRERPGLETQLDGLRDLGVSHVLVGSWDLLSPARDRGFTLHGDFGLGCCNSRTLEALAGLGLQSATASFELKFPALRDLAKPLELEAIVYGRLPLMLLEQFPGGQATDGLTDRLGLTFPVLPAPGERSELFNSQPLYLADKADWKRLGLTGARLLFTTESPEQCLRVAREYLDGGAPPKSFTRGLYYRDVE